MKSSSKIIFNTGVLYLKLLLGLAIGLISIRLVLAALGESDFGIYSLVAGVVGMLGILQGAMTSASMRFMSHSLGTGNKITILKTFNTTLFLHFVIGAAIAVLLEVSGFYMFKFLLNIPIDRIADAKMIFHFMVVTTFVSVISVPYDSVMFSNENIITLSLIDVLGIIVKLLIAIYITYSEGNILVLYGFLVLLNQIFLRIIKQIYSRFKYPECRMRLARYIDKSVAKQILSFTLWNLFGSLAAISVTQVRGLLLNVFFGVQLNAADGISKTASSQVNMVSSSMTRALNPQLVKSEGGGNRERMIYLTELATKYSVLLFALFAIPVISETSYLLNLWLVTVPEYAVIFCQLILITLLLDKFTFEITSAIRAVGRIKEFQIVETLIVVLNIPISYIFLKLGFPPYAIFYAGFFIVVVCFLVRLFYGRKIAKINIRRFLVNAIFPVFLPIIVAFFLSYITKFYIAEGFVRFFVTSILSIFSMIFIFWKFGLVPNERKKLIDIMLNIKKKIIS